MAIALVQHNSIDSTGFAVSSSFGVATTQSNLIVVGVRIGDQGLTNTVVTDDAGNLYSLASTTYVATLGTGYIFYARNCAPATTLTCTVTGGTSPTNRFCHYEYSGAARVNPFDVATSAFQLATATPNSSAITTTYPNELLFGICNVSNTRTITAGTNIAWVLREQLPTGAGLWKMGVEDFISTGAAGSVQANFNLNSADDALSIIATFKPTSSTDGAGFSRLLTGVGI
jgi:hypothetical protein